MEIIHGDCLEILKTFKYYSFDALITDPPAGIAFMGKEWDEDKGGRRHWIKWMTEVMFEVRRVLKPGAHGFVWALPRTSHWTATALEDAGFEIRDIVMHLFGTGFPKSLNVSKAIDKKYGANREILGPKKDSDGRIRASENHAKTSNICRGNSMLVSKSIQSNNLETVPSTNEAKQWDGWGTALKPACEHWILIRKPLSEKTIVDNVLKWGTGGINIDESRVGVNPGYEYKNGPGGNSFSVGKGIDGSRKTPVESTQGRFPANITLDEDVAKMLDEQSGNCKSRGKYKNPNKEHKPKDNTSTYKFGGLDCDNDYANQSGGASRFFYVAKASKGERNAGCEGLEAKPGLQKNLKPMSDPRMNREQKRIPNQNHHPTVKSLNLMKYLIRMITPPDGIILDPFAGSGSTLVACKELGFDATGIEKEKEYFEIANQRIKEAVILLFIYLPFF